eukprot:scaffold198201_cov21-Prasinocladus_malaysianus.AAC.1
MVVIIATSDTLAKSVPHRACRVPWDAKQAVSSECIIHEVASVKRSVLSCVVCRARIYCCLKGMSIVIGESTSD